MLAGYGRSFSRFKDFAKLSCCFSPPVFVFQLLIGVNPTTVFPGCYGQPWMIHILSRFVMQNFHFRLAFIKHSCSSWLYRDSQQDSQLQKEWKIWEKTRKSGQNKVNLAVCVASLWTNESLFQYTKLILIPVMRMFSYFSITSFLFSKNKWLYSHKWLKWMGVVRVN